MFWVGEMALLSSTMTPSAFAPLHPCCVIHGFQTPWFTITYSCHHLLSSKNQFVFPLWLHCLLYSAVIHLTMYSPPHWLQDPHRRPMSRLTPDLLDVLNLFQPYPTCEFPHPQPCTYSGPGLLNCLPHHRKPLTYRPHNFWSPACHNGHRHNNLP